MFLWNIAVTSLVEVWIEMMIGVTFNDPASLSLPLWKCGLKYTRIMPEYCRFCHFPCGSVD